MNRKLRVNGIYFVAVLESDNPIDCQRNRKFTISNSNKSGIFRLLSKLFKSGLFEKKTYHAHFFQNLMRCMHLSAICAFLALRYAKKSQLNRSYTIGKSDSSKSTSSIYLATCGDGDTFLG